MGSIGNTKDELVGLRVVRGPDWGWDTQDGGEGCVGTVIEIIGNTQNVWNLKVHWDSGGEFVYRVYRIGTEDTCDLRVLDNSTVGVKHFDVKCEGCNEEIAGLRWQCLDCPALINLCTSCHTNGKHEQTHVNFRRYDRPSTDPIVVRLDSAKQKNIPLKGIYPGALIRRGRDWNYQKEDVGLEDRSSINHPIGKVISLPIGYCRRPGKVWVQWPHSNDTPYSYRVGLSGKMDLEMVSAGLGGHYQPHTLPILQVFKSKEGKACDVSLPFVVGDSVMFTVELEELRKMLVDCGLEWNANEMKKVVNDVGTVKEIDKRKNAMRVSFPNNDGKNFRFPVKAMRRFIPWLPVGAMIQIHINGSNLVDVTDDVTGDFGRIKQVNLDGETVELEFITPGGRVEIRTLPVSQLKDKPVNESVIEKVESVRKDLAKFLISEVDKGEIVSVGYLLKYYHNIVGCQVIYNGKNSTALSVACQKGNLEMVKLLLKHGASVDVADKEQTGNKSIHHAVLGNHTKILQELLAGGALPNDINNNKATPLHLAAMKGYVGCARLLLNDKRCNLTLQDINKKTAFQLAVESSVQSVEIFHLFHATGKLNIIEKDHMGRSILHLASEFNNFGATKFLLSFPEGKKLAQNSFGIGTPLSVACRYRRNQIAKLLVSEVDKDENGKPWGIDTPNKEGKTPLMRVVEKFNYELIEHLIEAGANLQAIDVKGDTPFHYAARLFREKKSVNMNWPNEETAPTIFKLYKELRSKRPEENLCPIAAIICYLVINGGIPHNLTIIPDLKQRIDDDLLYEEIIKLCPDPDWPSQNLSSQATLQHSHVNTIEEEITQEKWTSVIRPRDQMQLVPKILNNEPFVLQGNTELIAIGYFGSGNQQSSTMNQEIVEVLENGIVIPGSQQEPRPSSPQPQQSDIVRLAPSDDNDPGKIGEPCMDEPISLPHTPLHADAAGSADTSIVTPVLIAGNSPSSQTETCTIEKTWPRNRKKVSNGGHFSLIIIDENGRRYSQQKDGSCIFQCTTNVLGITRGRKRCKGTINVKDLDRMLEEFQTNLETDPQKKYTFTVRNPHEEHLTNKRGIKSPETTSETPSTSSKKMKKV